MATVGKTARCAWKRIRSSGRFPSSNGQLLMVSGPVARKGRAPLMEHGEAMLSFLAGWEEKKKKQARGTGERRFRLLLVSFSLLLYLPGAVNLINEHFLPRAPCTVKKRGEREKKKKKKRRKKIGGWRSDKEEIILPPVLSRDPLTPSGTASIRQTLRVDNAHEKKSSRLMTFQNLPRSLRERFLTRSHSGRGLLLFYPN